jgi:tetratricopeptide (TPR) repeat protein
VSVAQAPSFAESIQPWMDRGDYAAALAAIEAHFRQDPGTKVDPAYSTARATALFHLNRPGEAREELRRAVPPTDAIDDMNARQWLWEQLGDLAGAETDLTKLLATFGPDAVMFSMRAGIRARQGNFAGVHEDWESARNIRESDPDHLRLVDALWSPIKKQVPGYLEYLRAKGGDLPRLPWIWNIDNEPWVFDSFLSDTNCSREAHAARVHACHDLELAFRTGDHRKALILLDRILYARPAMGNAADLSLLRALLLQRVGREPEMEAELGKPCHRQLSWKRIDARIYLWDQLKRWEDAEHFLTSMLEDPPDSTEDLDPKKLKLLKYRATVRARLGQFDAVSADRNLAMESFGLQAGRRAEVEQIWETLAQEFPAYAAHLRAAPEPK